MKPASESRVRNLKDIPEIPVNGNYIILGTNAWAHAETWSKAVAVWRGHGGVRKRVVADVSDDFQISHYDGAISAEKVTVVYRRR